MNSSQGAAEALEWSVGLLNAIAEAGRNFPAKPEVGQIASFRHFVDAEGTIDLARMDERDGGATRRELILRFLLVSAVVDQGMDIEGVRDFVVRVVNDFYSREVRIFHRPLDFFREFNFCVDTMDSTHDVVKAIHAPRWAEANRSTPGRYRLFAESRQTLGYAVYRWGAPLAMAIVAEKKASEAGRAPASALYELFRGRHAGYPWSTEGVTTFIKTHRTYGLGKAIGDKAANLFGKWAVHSYPLLVDGSDAWGPWSFEVPFDSNAGRVLYRTGFISEWVTDEALRGAQVLQPGAGKADKTYMRVTNLRGCHSEAGARSDELRESYHVLCKEHLAVSKRRSTRVEAQRVPSAISLIQRAATPGQIDDGLIKVGTTWCFNTGEPNCLECPLKRHCRGANDRRELITEVRT